MPFLLDSTAIFDYTVGYKGGVFNMQYLNTNTPTVNSTLFMMQVFNLSFNYCCFKTQSMGRILLKIIRFGIEISSVLVQK